MKPPDTHRSRPTRIGFGVWLFLLLVATGFAPARSAQPTPTQTITLNAGWNLISIQVGSGPLPVASFKAALDNPSTPEDESARLIEIWGYEHTGNPSVPGSWRTYQADTNLNFPSDLTVHRRAVAEQTCLPT